MVAYIEEFEFTCILVGSLPLCYNGKLIAAAITHTSDMVRNDFFSHIGSDGSAPSDRVTVAFYTWDAVAENIAWGQRSVASVMNSVRIT